MTFAACTAHADVLQALLQTLEEGGASQNGHAQEAAGSFDSWGQRPTTQVLPAAVMLSQPLPDVQSRLESHDKCSRAHSGVRESGSKESGLGLQKQVVTCNLVVQLSYLHAAAGISPCLAE